MPQVKTAIIEDVLNERIWDGPHGRMFYYTLVLDNEERGEIGTKKQDAYTIGQELTYTTEQTDRGLKFKRYFDPQGGPPQSNGQPQSQPQQNQQQAAPAARQFTGGGRGSNASFCLSYAKDLCIAAMPNHPEVTTNQWVEATLITASKFHAWMQEAEQQ